MRLVRNRKWVAMACALVSVCATAQARDPGREVLAPRDGWASLNGGTTGGANAAPGRTVTVRNRKELVAALAYPDATPKLIYVAGTIDANVDDANRPLACADYVRADAQSGTRYALDAYLAAYDPATWGRKMPAGPQERARLASAAAQQARVDIRVGPNTTIVGVGNGAAIRGGWLDIRPQGGSGTQRMNVIVRNLGMRDTFDCFPQWDPTDGDRGNWNSQYDAISVRNAANVWIDHMSFEDRDTPDAQLPSYFGRQYQIHDGALDVTNQSDLVTISWNRFAHHDKEMTIGNSDSASADAGKLRVTVHHNAFDDVVQRAPRVRYGKVHVYNNYYNVPNAEDYVYSWGVGKNSAIYAENNAFRTVPAIRADFLIERLNGTALRASGTWFNGATVDVVAAYNAVNATDLSGNVGWTPSASQFTAVDTADRVVNTVPVQAGPFVW